MVSARQRVMAPSPAESWVLVGLLPASAIILSRRVHDSFQLPKLVLIMFALGIAAALFIRRSLGAGAFVLPTGPTAWATVGFVVACLAASVGSDVWAVSLLGQYGRLGGFLSYLAYAAVFVLMVITLEAREVERFAVLLIAVTSVVAGYSLVQWAGLDPFDWGGEFAAPVTATLGNPNFASGWFGIAVPVAIWGVIQTHRPWVRWMSGLTAILVILGLIATSAIQGILGALAGAGIVVAGLLLRRGGSWMRLGLPALAATALTGGVLVGISVLTGAGPLGFLGTQIGSVLRRLYWGAAVSIFVDFPLLGVGLERFGAYFPAHRDPKALDVLPIEFEVDEPHSVVLGMFAEGGLVLGLAYVAFVLAVAVVLVRGLRRLHEERLILLAGLGGAWTAYQVQSLVSIDVPALALAHWVLAAAILIVAGAPRVAVPIPGLASQAERRGKQRAGVQRRRANAQRIVSVAGAVGVVLLLFAVSVPWRADAALRNAVAAERSGAPEVAWQNANRAVDLMPWWPTYWYEASQLGSPDADSEIALLEGAVARDPRSLRAQLALARAHLFAGQPDEAVDAYETVVDLDPLTPQYKAEYGEALLRADRPREAVAQLETALAVDADPVHWLLLGRAHEALDEIARAADAFEQVLVTADAETPQRVVDEARQKLASMSS